MGNVEQDRTNQSQNSIESAGFLRLPQVLELFPISRARWWAGVKSGEFPAGIHLTPRTTAWLRSDIVTPIKRRAAKARDHVNDPA